MTNVLSNLSGLLKRTHSLMDELRRSLQGIRSHVADLKDRRTEIEAIPVTVDVAVSRAEKWAERKVASAQQSVIRPTSFAIPEAKWATRSSTGEHDFGALSIAYMGDAFIEAVKQEVIRAYGDERGISEKERQRLLAENDAELLAAELSEESLIRGAEDQGFDVDRREDADPRAVLAHESCLP